MTEAMRNRILIGSLLIVSPIFLTRAYLHLADWWPLQWGGITDLAAAALLLGLGIGGICLLPIPGLWRATVSAGYAVCGLYLMFLFAIMFRGGL